MPTSQLSQTEALQKEIDRLNRVIKSLIARAEREAGAKSSQFAMFWGSVVLENQVRKRTDELEKALRDNERITKELTAEKEEQRILIKKLESARNQLLQSEKLASIGQLAAGVAHEINNPIGFVNSNLISLEKYALDLLSLVDCYSQVEKELAPTSLLKIREKKQEIDLSFLREDIIDLLTESKDGTIRVKKIVQDLRDFSRAGEAEWKLFNVHEGIESTLNVVRNEIKYKAEVIKQYGLIPPIMCIPSQLNQVFLNLLVNAVQAIPEKGTITITTRHVKDVVEVLITDSGVGISDEIKSKIFDPFFTTKPVGKGTGLGLSVTYGIIERHSGNISVQSKVNEGTTFTIALPVQRTEPRV